MRGGLQLVVLCLAAACATAPGLPSQGARWLELRSQSFVLFTDLPEREATRTLRELESTLDGYLASAWTGWPRPPAKLRVVMLASQSEYQSFEPSLGGFTFRVASERVLVTFPRASDELRGRRPEATTFSPLARNMRDADAGALMALLTLEGAGDDLSFAEVRELQRRVRAHLEPALREGDSLPLAIFVRQSMDEIDEPARQQAAARAVAAHPDDWLAHYLYVRELAARVPDAELWGSVERGLALNPLEPLFNLHASRILRGREKLYEADGFSQVALRFAPHDADIVIERSAVLGALGRCSELERLQRRALADVTPDRDAHAKLNAALAAQMAACKTTE